jgi:Chalcone isomerase-like
VKHLLALVAAFAVVALLFIPVKATSIPTALQIGNQSLAAASCATRDTLWIHHYAAALYVPPREPAVIALQDPKRPKAVQVEVLNKSFLPKDVPTKYRRTLEDQLDAKTLGSVKSAWRTLNAGDRITLAYAPGQGLTLTVNDRLVATTPNHGIVEALLKVWADNEPVPQRVNRILAQHPCQR